MVERLNSVMIFDKIQVPFTEHDVINKGITTDFADAYPWIDVHETKEHNLKYKINSNVLFMNWLIQQDNLVIKNDWGYFWNGSYWDRMNVKDVNNMIDVSIMFICDKLRISNSRKRELQKDVKSYLIERSRGFDDSVKPDYIGFKNWTLNVRENNFFEPVKDMNIINGFNFEPEANKLPETWVAYSKYMFGDNARFVWAWFGYAFQNDMGWKQGALFLLDPIGGTGKTHFVTQITQAMFGKDRVGAFKLKNLQGNNARFETARFVGKSLMVDDDASKVRFREDDTFKSVTGGGLSPVERKGIDGTDYKITAKMIINVNEMPTFNDSGAIKRRLHVVKTVAPVADTEEIMKREELFPTEKLLKETPMLATYAIEQYQDAVMEDWKIYNDIVDDIVALDPFSLWQRTLIKGERKASELYAEYEQYFLGLNLGEDNQPMTMSAWGRKMVNWYTKKKTMQGMVYEIK